jgi:hypothetical protein
MGVMRGADALVKGSLSAYHCGSGCPCGLTIGLLDRRIEFATEVPLRRVGGKQTVGMQRKWDHIESSDFVDR